MVNIGKGFGKKTVAVISDMEQPLGNAIGNSIEIIEAIETLKGNGPKDLEELCLTLGAQMLTLGGVAKTPEEARKKLKHLVSSGEALEKLKQFVEAQGGNKKQVENTSLLPKAKFKREILATQDGFVKSIKAEAIGVAAMMLGAGRETKESEIDLSAGIYLNKKIGDAVKKGETVALIFSNKKSSLSNAEEQIISSYSFSKKSRRQLNLILGTVSSD